MPIWNRIKDEVERAGRAAHSAIDEGKLRLDLLRSRQAADRSAQRLGYAIFKAKSEGKELAEDVYSRHANELSAAEAEIARIETLLKEAAARRTGGESARPEQPTPPAYSTTSESEPKSTGPSTGAGGS